MKQMTDHTLDTIKNSVSNMYHLDHAAKVSDNVEFVINAGRVVHVNNQGEYEPGLPDIVGACHMPIFLFANSDDFDVANDGGDRATQVFAYVPINPTGVVVGLVATGAYELESTEFEPESSLGGAPYTPGDALTAPHSVSNSVIGGRITRITAAYSKPMCGVVSDFVKQNKIGRVNVLRFWPVWLPANTARA